MFLAFGCCIRVASFFHRELQLTPVLAEVGGPIVQDRQQARLSASHSLPLSSSVIRTPGVLTALLSSHKSQRGEGRPLPSLSSSALISALGPNTAVVLTSTCFPKTSRNVLQSDLRPLKEMTSPQRTSLPNVVLHLPVSNTDAELVQGPSDQNHHIKHLPVEWCPCISQSIHCFELLADLVTDGQKDISCMR